MLLEVDNLHTHFGRGGDAMQAVKGISFHIDEGETFCLVGESGSGKSVTGLSIMRLIPEPGHNPAGRVMFQSHGHSASPVDLLQQDQTAMQSIRGDRISMIFQEPMTALNPVMTIGEQILEPLEMHLGLVGQAAWQRAVELLQRVEMPDAERRLNEYPHRLSGGQRQRVMIAMALACEPDLLIADEPTTALDVTIQAQILNLLAELQRTHNTALLFITHDLSVVAQIADRIAVMRQGEIVEQGSRDDVLFSPQHAYTKELLAALPVNLERLKKPRITRPVPLISVRNLKVYFPIRKGILQRHVGDMRAVDDVSLDITRGKALALVGESGSGKTTLGRALLGLITPTGGQTMYDGVDLASLSRRQFKPYRRDLQIVFQDPQSSLNPRLTIATTITEPMAVHGIGDSPEQRMEMAAEIMRKVGLTPEMLRRFPHEFSGGERQRIGIARALALNPKFIVCDEVTSALDVSVQARVLALLDELRTEFDLTYLFITHNIDVVRYFADDVAVMYQGKVVEHGDVSQVCDDPQHPYTQRLLDAVPKFAP
ncbi:MAG: dipeptide ABC transporter ATP-binding protein [Gammaproteobacteria bacterium]|nr:dipeptide ABC transporter ATP-binding protein [Gammaproteobacteria bacterium]